MLTNQGLTITKYGISQINDNTVLPCITIEPNPSELKFKCINDDGSLIETSELSVDNYWFVKNIFNFGQKKITVSLWNFSYIVFGAIGLFLIIFLFVIRIDK